MTRYSTILLLQKVSYFLIPYTLSFITFYLMPFYLMPYTLYLLTLCIIPFYLIPFYLIHYTLNLISCALYLVPYTLYLVPFYLIPYTLYLFISTGKANDLFFDKSNRTFNLSKKHTLIH